MAARERSKKVKARTVLIGLVQMRSRENPAENLTIAAHRIVALAKRGAKIICLPELFLTPYFCQRRDKHFFALAEPIPGPTSHVLADIARRNKVTIITSLFERARNNKFYNTALVLSPSGKINARYRKMHIPDDPHNYYDEAYYFSSGTQGTVTVRVGGIEVSPMICWDQWFPEGARSAAAGGAQIIFYPTAIGWQREDPRGVNKAEHGAWQTIQRAHAIANNVFVVAVNRVGKDDHLQFWGTSFVSDPYGAVIAKASSTKEEDLLVNCDLSLIAQMRRDWPFLKARRFSVRKQ
ncbi:acyltransferase [Candidatus Uhrbacteria bacterium CG10_big_fil_rev_8_21_14_0_10_48_11]|uniref:Acyltransferase n=1 Tax=Candidatus Uhrbacteria bacterium CG10_big_fil_rev_8_21_14_0_10_48_11 TaxID=1975037 RepID=A0A2M8LDM1_9BACT|nr:MAG: acyltransferase [Candidatus Uhrbacteria bacterium CG10_big_fil_rev_8_21_14_0_10_48_11]